MVDADNEIFIVVENKHGANFGESQLEEYYSELSAQLRRRPAFANFKTAFIALDRNYVKIDSDNGKDESQSNRWAYVDYQWLENGARRAESQLRRGNQSASLVISYCQTQTDYVPPEEKNVNDTLAILVQEYRPILDNFVTHRKRHLSDLTPSDLQGDMWMYVNHHSEIIDRMIDMKSLAFLETGLKNKMPKFQLESEFGKRYVNFHEKSWGRLMNSTGVWPVYIKARQMKESKKSNPLYTIATFYYPREVNEAFEKHLHQVLQDEFSELKKGRLDANYRTLGRESFLSESEVESRLTKLFERTHKVINSITS